MIELEKKLLLTKDEYDCLIEYFRHKGTLVPKLKQINYYFDTDDLSMNRENITCRIRLKGGTYKGTLKQHSIDSDHSIETAMEVRNGLKSNAFTDMGLKLQGALVTKRCVLLKNESFEVVLDQNDYLGCTDYELEIEYSENHEKDAEVVLQMLQDTLIRQGYFHAYQESFMDLPNTKSKSKRFFERKKSITQKSQKGEKQVEERIYVHPTESESQADLALLHENMDTFDHSNPDDYMTDYYGSILPYESGCASCPHFIDGCCEIHYDSYECEHY